MMQEQHFNLMLAEFGERLGIGPLTFDDDQTAAIAFSEDLIVLLSLEEDALLTYAKVGTALDGNAEFAEALLSANLFWEDTRGATVSLEPFSRAILLALRTPADSIASPQVLESHLEAFAELAQEWQQIIQR
ncbi:MAG: CesT family type III secretion system chaperone, partial [Betaproteobacteria bacterium]|nr:CesT family type III secretion system chaperone [Betaproteobacteria bacterium]